MATSAATGYCFSCTSSSSDMLDYGHVDDGEVHGRSSEDLDRGRPNAC